MFLAFKVLLLAISVLGASIGVGMALSKNEEPKKPDWWKCYKCGERVTDSSRTCHRCGHTR